jgi:hypothetical protein
MLAKAGFDNARQEGDLDRHIQMLTRFLERVRADGSQDRTVTLLLRSAESDPAQAAIALQDALAEAGVRLRVILSNLDSGEATAKLASVLRRLNGADFADCVRWARKNALLDAHEQAVYGEICWAGDSLRRDASRRNALSMFCAGRPDRVNLAMLGFTALWHASEPVPARRLAGALSPNASATYEHAPAEEPVEPPVMAPVLQPWPLIRH